jgi:outer membrane protein TolC
MRVGAITKPWLQVVTLLVGLCMLAPHAMGQGPVFSLFRRASEESPSLKALQKGPEEAYLMEQVERRRGWPQVSFETNFTLYDSHQEDAYRDQEFFITIDMDIFGKHALRATALEAEYTLAREHQRMEKWRLFQQVAKCYYRLVTSFGRERLANEELEWASELYRKTQTLVKMGVLPEADLIKAESELQEARLSVEDAFKDKEMSLVQMRMWIPDFNLETTPLAPEVTPTKVDRVALFKALIRFSPRMRNLQAKEGKAIKEARSERFSFLPDLKLKGGYVVHREEDDTGDYWMWSAGVSLPLFDGGVRERRVKLKKTEAEKIGFQIDALRRELALKASNLSITLNNQYEKWRLLKREAELYQEMVNKMYKAYSFGGVGIEELIRTNRKAQEKRNKLLELSCGYNYTRDVVSYVEQQGGKE